MAMSVVLPLPSIAIIHWRFPLCLLMELNQCCFDQTSDWMMNQLPCALDSYDSQNFVVYREAYNNDL